jgi:predicted kinase
VKPSRPLYVVVSGPPGSGKTTLATGTASQLRLPLIAKDLIKEALMSGLAVPDIARSKVIGRAAVEVMYAVAAASPVGAVLEANFHRSVARSDIQALPGLIVEVFCRCDREVALTRYRERSEQRHPGHLDQLRADDELWNDEVTAPIAGGWAVLEVDTNLPVDTSGVVSDIRMRVGSR